MNQDRQGARPVILQVIPRLGIGGAERAVIDTARAVIDAGGDALVVSEGGALEAELLRTRARHHRMPVASKSPISIQRNASRLARLIDSEGVDLVHARSRAPAWSACQAARRTGRPFVTTFHAAYGFRSRIKKYYNSVMARGDRVIAISDFIARHVRDNYGIGDDRLRRIHRGVDVIHFDPAAVNPDRVADLAASWNLPDGVPVVMLPARLSRWKGHDVMIEAMQMLAKDAVCLLVGAGSGPARLRHRLEKDISDRGLQDKVMLIEGCGDMPAAYRLADVVVSASTRPEGFGRVAVEAQAMGVPVVATDCGGSVETIEPGVTGWLVPRNDPRALAEAVAEALSLAEGERVAWAAVARARMVERFSRDAMCAATLDVYRQLIDWP